MELVKDGLMHNCRRPSIENQHQESHYLTIIPRARMGSESIAHEAIDSEAMRARGIIVLVKSN